LLKISLILGVEIVFNVTFEQLISPLIDKQDENASKGGDDEGSSVFTISFMVGNTIFNSAR